MQSNQFRFPVLAINEVSTDTATTFSYSVPAGFDFLFTDFYATSQIETEVVLFLQNGAVFLSTNIGGGTSGTDSFHWQSNLLIPSGSILSARTFLEGGAPQTSLIVSGSLLTPTSATLQG